MSFNDTWTGVISTDWNTAGNWNNGSGPATAPPTSSDTANVNAGTGAVVITGSGALQSQTLNLSSSGAGSISLTGSFYTGYNSGALSFGGLVDLSGFIYDYGTASFGAGAEIDGGTVTVTGASTFAGGFTVDNAGLALATTSTATLTTLTLIGAASLSGDITANALSDAGATSLTLGTGVFDISGSSSASPALLPALTIAGVVTLEGVFNSTANPAPSLTVNSGAQLYIDAGDALIAATANFAQSGYVSLTDGTLTVTGAASFGTSLYLTGAGSFTVDGTMTTNGGYISAANSSRVEIGSLNGVTGGLTLYADATSAIEIGNQNVAAAGSITIDTGVAFTESGTFNAPVIVVNGVVTVAPGKALTLDGTTTNRGLTGSGTLDIDTGSSLTLDNVDPGTSDLVTINFAQAGGLLWLPTGDFDAQGNFKPAITGFSATDVIEYGGTATSATYSGGFLSLFNGANLVAKFNIGAGYTGDTFSTVPIAGNYTQIDLAGTPAGAPAGTAGADSYTWVGPVAGFWNATANWDDLTAGQNPASAAPGANDLVTVAAAAGGAAQVIVGNGNAAALTLDGETLLDGVFNVGASGLSLASSASAYLYTGSSLNVAGNAAFASYAAVTLNGGAFRLTGTGTVTNAYANTFTIENGGAMSAISLVNYYSSYTAYTGSALTATNVSDASGAGSSFTANGGAITVKSLFTSSNDGVYARNGGTVQIANLVEDSSGRGVSLDVYDSTSSIEIGTTGGVAGGTITIDSGKTVTEAGSFYATTLVDTGALRVGMSQSLYVAAAVQDTGGVTLLSGASMTISGALTLTGSVTIDPNAKFSQSSGLSGAGQIVIDAGAKATLSYDPGASSAQIQFNGPGAQLGIDTSDLSAGAFSTSITGFLSSDVIDFTDSSATITAAHYAGGALSLYSGATVVATLNIGAGYTDTFSVLPLASSVYQIDYLGGGTSGAPGGTGTADSYTWIGPVAGNWKTAANWQDVTAGQNPATLAPGSNDLVTIPAAAGGAAQVIVGNGDAYQLTIDGETLLDGAFLVGAGGLSLASSASAYLYVGSTLNVAGNAAFASYASVTLNGGGFHLTGTGTLTNAYANAFAMENGGAMSAIALVDYYSNYTVYAGSTLNATNVSDTSGAGSSFNANGGAITIKSLFTSSNDGVYARNGGKAQLDNLVEDSSGRGVTLNVYDTSSSIEIGATGGVAGGSITIDSGKAVTEAGSFYATNLVDAGLLRVGAAQSLYVNAAVQDQGGIIELAGATLTITGALTLTSNLTLDAGAKLSQSSGLSGAGKITIDAGARAALSYDPGASSAQIAFNGAGAQLAIDTTDLNSSNAFATAITGFLSSDVIDFTDSANAITNVHYSGGTLSLYNGASVVATLNIGAGYTDTFSVLPLAGSVYQIDYLGGGTIAAPSGTNTADAYTWIGAVAGNWHTPGNWKDTTAGQNPATAAPGKNDLVTIPAAAGGAAQVIVGNGNAYQLTIDGETLLDGLFLVGAGGLSVASSASIYLYAGSTINVAGNAAFASYASVTLNGGAFHLTGTGAVTNAYANTFTVENGGAMSAVALVDYYSSYTAYVGSTLSANSVSDASGAGSSFTANGGAITVKTLFTSSNDGVYARNGGAVQLANLVEDSSGRGVTLEVYDASSSIEIGATGGVAGGTITVDSGKTVTEAGSFYAPTIVDAGALRVGNNQTMTISGVLQVAGSLTLMAGSTLNQYGATTGSGAITLVTGSKLALSGDNAATSVQIAFSGIGDRLVVDTSDLNASNAFAPAITGFTVTDVIDFTYGTSALTAAHYAGGTLSLYSGASVVATFNVGAGYADYWTIVPINGGSTYQINYEGGKPAAMAPGGTQTGDAFQWVGHVTGFWNQVANWDDTTLGQNPAAAAPGAKDTVTFAAAANGEVQVVDGAGTAFGMTVEGETLLLGVFNIVGTGARGGLTETSSASLVLDAGSSLTDAGDASLGSYAGVTLNGGAMVVSGTLYGGYGSQLTVENGGSLKASQIVDYATTLNVVGGASVTDSGNVSDSGTGSGGSSYTANGAKFTVQGTFVSTGDALYARNGGQIQIAALQEDVHNNLVYFYDYDTASVEIGTEGGVAAGSITIDTGIGVTEGGTFYAPSIIDNGALTVAAGQTLYLEGELGGSGSVNIDAGSTLVVYGALASGTNTVAFAGAGGTVQFADSNGLPNGMTLTGWTSGENLEVRGVTDAAYVAGSLVLYSNGATVGSLKVGASYAGDSFDVVPLSNGYSQIALGPSWLNPVSGNFATAGDWSTGAAPGAADSAAISATGNYIVSITANTTVRSIEETASGATLSIGAGDTLSLNGASNFNGVVSGGGTLALTGGSTTFDGSGSITVGSWTLAGAGASIVAGQTLAYAGTFQAGSSTTVTVSGGNFSLTGPTSFTGVTVNGSKALLAQGTTSVTGLTIGGTAIFKDAATLTQSGGTVTVGDSVGDAATLSILSTGVWDITDNSIVAQGSSTASAIANSGTFEKTGGGGTTTVAPVFANAFDVLVSSGTLDFKAAVSGTGTDTIQGASTALEFDSTISAGQTVDFSATNELLNLTDALGYGGSMIDGFVAGDHVDLNGSWTFSSFNENAGGTVGTLTLANGANLLSLEFGGSFTQSSFSIASGSTTVIGHT